MGLLMQPSYLHSMFTRITENGGWRYLQIAGSFRNEAGKPRLRVVANLGRVDEIKDGQLDALIRGRSRAAGRVTTPSPEQLDLFDTLNLPKPA